MRLIQWNCQGGFRKKNKQIFSYNPDIIVVCESENPDKLKFGKLTPTPNDFYWYGESEHRII